MAPSGDDTLVARCRQGDQAAARELFDRYVARLLMLAKGRISQRLTSRFDPEDVVQSVFRTFFVRLRKDEFDFGGQDDLFKLLARITMHKTLRLVAHHTAAKRDAGHEARQADDSNAGFVLAQALDAEPGPDTVVAFMDQFEHFMGTLSEFDRQVLELRLQNYSSDEIAAKLGTYDRKIRRVLERLRDVATEEEKLFE